MATFSALPYDVTYQILDNLYATDLRSLKSLSATCRRTRHEAIPIIFASLYFYEDAPVYTIDNMVGRILAVLINPQILASVRRFCMRADDGMHLSLIVSSLFRLIASMPNLHDLYFDAPRTLAAHLRIAASPLDVLLHDEEIPMSLVAAYLDAKPFDTSTYRLPSVQKLVLASWEWSFLADYCPQMQILEVRGSSVGYNNLRGQNCFEVDIAHLSVTHPNIRCLHLDDSASIEIVSALTKSMPNIEELGFHSPVAPSTNALTHFSSFGNLHTLALPDISDLRGIPRWDESACDLCKGRAMIIRQEVAKDVIEALQTQVVSLREVQFGFHARREVYQRSADGTFTYVKLLSRPFYYMMKDDVTLFDPPPKEPSDRKGKGKAQKPFGTSSTSDSPPHIYAPYGSKPKSQEALTNPTDYYSTRRYTLAFKKPADRWDIRGFRSHLGLESHFSPQTLRISRTTISSEALTKSGPGRCF
ncbi:hypothetical protein PIIN_11707 [Serendipita indica DSM 11827]|uniref:F-box domain-containing protein n=1 Tax=Serendipita indica (strain DSM 11827) TaxID=1109443 RepID=G4T630_SERID|nr:hypothetical protein PIIN_11707 [Serendipita indica DSM 11827]